MKTTIFYFSGTGNSLWIAELLASKLSETELFAIPTLYRAGQKITLDSQNVGIIFPIYFGGLPLMASKFLKLLNPGKTSPYIFAIATYAGGRGNALAQLDIELKEQNLSLSAGFVALFPSNYIPLDEANSSTEIYQALNDFKKELVKIVPIIKNNQIHRPIDLFPANVPFFLPYYQFINRLPTIDNSFWVDANCTGCEICVQVCLAKNISLDKARKPVWHHHCEFCLACIQWCPQVAIQFGKNTVNRKRYTNPEITLKKIILE